MIEALLRSREGSAPSHPAPGTSWRGTIARNPTADGVGVTLDAYGPQLFTARYRVDDLPSVGDDCLVVFDDQTDPWVVVVWA